MSFQKDSLNEMYFEHPKHMLKLQIRKYLHIFAHLFSFPRLLVAYAIIQEYHTKVWSLPKYQPESRLELLGR